MTWGGAVKMIMSEGGIPAFYRLPPFLISFAALKCYDELLNMCTTPCYFLDIVFPHCGLSFGCNALFGMRRVGQVCMCARVRSCLSHKNMERG